MFSEIIEPELDLLFLYSVSLKPDTHKPNAPTATLAQRAYVQDIIMYGGYCIAAQLSTLQPFIYSAENQKEEKVCREWFTWGMRKEI
ncbi:hypothetical protein CVT24_006673, partial [Panaeolus cyanescens]